MNRASVSRKIFIGINTLVLCAFSFICLYPVLYVLFASLSDANLLMVHRGFLWAPMDLNFGAYKAMAENPMILSGYGNTLFVVITSVIINIVMTSIGAYFLSRKGLMLRKAVMIYILITMYFSGGLIPLFLTVRNLGLYNSLWSLILPTAMNTFNLVIMRTSFEAIPDSLVEAALIDGAGHINILFRVILPLSKAIIATTAFMQIVNFWNNYTSSILYITTNTAIYPVQAYIQNFMNRNPMEIAAYTPELLAYWNNLKTAYLLVAIVPVICAYPFMYRFLQNGLTVGAVKG